MDDFDLKKELGFEEISFKPGFRPLGTLDPVDKNWLRVKHQVVAGVWAVIIHSETA